MNAITDSMDMNLGELWQMVKDREAWCVAVQGVSKVGCDLVTEQQQNVVFSPHLTPTPRLSAYAMSLSYSEVSGAIF